MNKKYIVRLTDEERQELVAVITKLKGTSQKVKRAQILLKADADGPNWPHHQSRYHVKKNKMTKRKIQYWVIPPEQNSEFVACMEDVLNVYCLPYDPDFPVLCMDEQPVQLLKETRNPIAATLNHSRRVDYEYERAGTASLFMFTEPLPGWREVHARPQRTKADWAIEMADLLEGRYADAKKVFLVCDNLNTHTKGAFYEVFAPQQACAYVEKIEFHYTPKHGS